MDEIGQNLHVFDHGMFLKLADLILQEHFELDFSGFYLIASDFLLSVPFM